MQAFDFTGQVVNLQDFLRIVSHLSGEFMLA
jgi:hypothetical protein